MTELPSFLSGYCQIQGGGTNELFAYSKWHFVCLLDDLSNALIIHLGKFTWNVQIGIPELIF